LFFLLVVGLGSPRFFLFIFFLLLLGVFLPFFQSFLAAP
jgi:hypothetical protein